jgi:hypothetical protein
MEEDKNLEQNLDKSNEKLHISDVIRCKFSAIISAGAAYMVCDEDDNIIGYSDTLGMIDYDTEFRHNKPYTGEIEVISVDESAWD